MLIDGKSSQQYPVNVGVPQYSILYQTLFVISTEELLDDICNVAIYADDTTRYLKYDTAFDLWQLLALVCELKIRPTRHSGERKWLVDFNVGRMLLSGKTQCWEISSAFNVKLDGFFI